MSLTLHYHPLSSHCWKLLIALDELGLPFEPRIVNLGHPAERAAYAALWPTAKIPLLVDGDRVIPETTIQLEYLDHHHGGAARLLPDGFDAQQQVRLWERLFDAYVMHPMQRYIAQQLRPEAQRDAIEQAEVGRTLAMAYDMIEQRRGPHTWAAADSFSMADCTAAPALFYATTILPLTDRHRGLQAYVDRLLARPSVARTLEQARPFFRYYPLHHALPARFRDG
ncbi:glutathione S-transferase family protein [Roseateles sp. BYS96W]|uniref:Glutathione S-transferase family protein n=1 Tax=Pelomonas nitida TaxID=3299027 RepID=A0ABW7G1W0_9BURK